MQLCYLSTGLHVILSESIPIRLNNFQDPFTLSFSCPAERLTLGLNPLIKDSLSTWCLPVPLVCIAGNRSEEGDWDYPSATMSLGSLNYETSDHEEILMYWKILHKYFAEWVACRPLLTINFQWKPIKKATCTSWKVTIDCVDKESFTHSMTKC